MFRQQIFCGINITELAVKLETLQSEILRNNTDFLRYAKMSEGMKAFDHLLSPNEATEMQQIIIEQLQMLDTPAIIAVHKALP